MLPLLPKDSVVSLYDILIHSLSFHILCLKNFIKIFEVLLPLKKNEKKILEVRHSHPRTLLTIEEMNVFQHTIKCSDYIRITP